MKNLELIAWIGAITGVVSLLWNVFSKGYFFRLEKKGRIKIVLDSHTPKVEDRQRNIKKLYFMVTNTGYEIRTIYYLGVSYSNTCKDILKSRVKFVNNNWANQYAEISDPVIDGFLDYRFGPISFSKSLNRGDFFSLNFHVERMKEVPFPKYVKILAKDSFGKNHFSRWYKIVD